ncbi:hypothetical protein SLS60_006042 [Paraconiothyrium brasiliense]|uniref:Ketoreductase domain-containing protein n=1 Tax=Paraconiothyrium brasiliense TaxID=300254 RepID=A0ABR3RDW3_9PLEO
MGALFTKNEFPVEGRTVLITGGSKGLGLAAAQQLAAKGANVIIVARGQESLATALKSITETARNPETQRFHSIQSSVTTAEACSRVITEATGWNDGQPPDIVWCCSGSAHPTLFADTPIEQFQTMMDSNYFSCVYMAHATLNAWLRSKIKSASNVEKVAKNAPIPARHIIFTGSFVSFYSFAGFTPYAPSKAAIRSLSDSLSQEMNLYATSRPDLPRMRIHTVFPATMHTQSCADEDAVKSDLTKSLEEGDQILEPDECARRAISGLEGGEELVATSLIIRAVMASVLGGAVRGGFWRGLVNTVLGWITAVVMVFIRWEMDTKVKKWGRKYGSSGYRKKD